MVPNTCFYVFLLHQRPLTHQINNLFKTIMSGASHFIITIPRMPLIRILQLLEAVLQMTQSRPRQLGLYLRMERRAQKILSIIARRLVKLNRPRPTVSWWTFRQQQQHLKSQHLRRKMMRRWILLFPF